MRTSSAKGKGRRLQQAIRDKILLEFKCLEPDDVVSTGMGQSGVDICLSPRARDMFPYSVESKNQEALSIWSALEQAEKNTKPNTKPLLVFKRNRSKTYAVVEMEHFVELVRELHELKNGRQQS